QGLRQAGEDLGEAVGRGEEGQRQRLRRCAARPGDDEVTPKSGDWSRPCLDCGKVPADGAEFNSYVDKKGKHYRKSYCVPCCRQRSRNHYKRNPEQAKAREKRRTPRDWRKVNEQKWKSDGVS